MKSSIKDEAFWDTRAKRYDKLQWANKSDYLRLFVQAGEFKKSDHVLDLGTGTGIIAHTLSPYVKEVVGVDISDEMLKNAEKANFHNVRYQKADGYHLPFKDQTFDKITARMVFHHLVTDTVQAMKECFRVLKKGGRMVFSEGVPPTAHVIPFYTEMFKLKEERITFMEPDLMNLMREGGFTEINTIHHIAKNCSIRNWLENSDLPQGTQDKIFKMHVDLDDQGKKDYEMVIKDEDCFINMKFIILEGIKA